MTLPETRVKLSETLQRIILTRIESGELVLPVLPKLGQELKQALEDPKADLPKLTKLIEADPILTAHVLQVANSALHRRSGKIESFSQAVEHLGFRNIKNLLTTTISRTIFISHDTHINNALNGIIEHCQAVAILARNVAGIAGAPDTEPSYVAGLLHDIGKLVTAVYLLEFERSMPTREAIEWITREEWLLVINSIHRTIGQAFIANWGLPEILEKIVDESDNYDTSDRVSPLNSVLFSNALAKREGLYEGSYDSSAVNSMIMIGKSLLGVDDDVIAGLTREISDHIF